MLLKQPSFSKSEYFRLAMLTILAVSLPILSVVAKNRQMLASRAQQPTPTITPNPRQSIKEEVAPLIYILNEKDKESQATARLQAKYGLFGLQKSFSWTDINPQPGVYDWSKIDNYLKKLQKQSVTLPKMRGGKVINQPVQLMLNIVSLGNNNQPVDQTPEWVYQQLPQAPQKLFRSLVGYVVAPQNCPSGAVPAYDNPEWQKAYTSMIFEFGRRYNNHPQIAGIWIGAGLDGEISPVSAGARCDYMQELEQYLSCQEYVDFLSVAFRAYSRAFSGKPLWVAGGGSFCAGERANGLKLLQRQLIDELMVLGIGYKENNFNLTDQEKIDNKNAAVDGRFSLLTEILAKRQEGQKIPLAVELASDISLVGKEIQDFPYWLIHKALVYRPDFISLSTEWLDKLEKTPDIFEYISLSLGVDQRNSTDVWLIFGSADQPQRVSSRSNRRADLGDTEFFLKKIEKKDSETTSLITRSDLPPKTQSSPYSRLARSTKEAIGNNLIPLDVDDGWRYGQGRFTGPYLVRVWYLDLGFDEWALDYTDKDGVLFRKTVKKNNTGEWKVAEWKIDNMSLTNRLPARADIRLNSLNNGDEIFHKVLIRAVLNSITNTSL